MRVSAFTPAAWITLLLLFFYTGCYSLRMVVSAGLVGLPGGWGWREVGHQSTRKKKSLAGPQVGWRGWRGWRAGVSVQCAGDQCVAS